MKQWRSTGPDDCGLAEAEAPDDGRHSFIVRLWLEEDAEERRPAAWSGQIAHVKSNRRCYFKDPNRLSRFLALYLVEMKARLSMAWRIRLWLNRVKGDLSL